MESQLKRTSTHPRWLLGLSELLMVFLPALLFISVMSSWVGQDAIRSMVVIWVANILMLVMVWVAMKLRHRSWEEVGLTFSRIGPLEGLRAFGLSLLVFVVGITGFLIGPIVLTSFFPVKESADFSRYEFLKGNPWGFILSLAGVYVVSSFGEEVIYRAFLIRVFSEMTRGLRYASTLAVILSATLFGLAHYEWGFMGMIQTGCMGLGMGICYILLKKRLWLLILAHAYMDTILLVQLYLASN